MALSTLQLAGAAPTLAAPGRSPVASHAGVSAVPLRNAQPVLLSPSTPGPGSGLGGLGTTSAAVCLTGFAAAVRSRRRSVVVGGARVRQRGAAVARRAEAEVMGGFASACSMARDWKQAIDEVVAATGTGYEAGFAFVSEDHVTIAQGLAPVLERLREQLGVQTLIGCACGGGIGQAAGEAAVEYAGGGSGIDWPPIEAEKGTVLSVGLLKKAGSTPFFLGRGQDGELGGDNILVEKKAETGDVRSILLIADPFCPREFLLKKLDESFPKAVKAGGISAALQVGARERGAYMPSLAIAAEGCQVRLCSQGIVGLMLSELELHTIVCQGCCGVGPPVRVSSVNGPVLDGIGGRPAHDALRLIFSGVDPPTRDKMQRFLLIGLGRAGESEGSLSDGDWLIRMISGVTPEGGLVVGDDVEEGQPLRFHVRDRESAENDLELMMKRYRLEKSFRSSGRDPMGCFLFTCNGRGEGLYQRRHVDARAVAGVIPDSCSTRVAGFFCNGELGAPGIAVPTAAEDAPVRDTAVHGFTAVFALLLPVSEGE